MTKPLGTALAAAAVWLLLTVPAAGQCAMCSAVAEGAGDPERVAKTLNTAILVMMVPTLGLLGAFGTLLWRYRGDGVEADS